MPNNHFLNLKASFDFKRCYDYSTEEYGCEGTTNKKIQIRVEFRLSVFTPLGIKSCCTFRLIFQPPSSG
jgi:hypothetical protein